MTWPGLLLSGLAVVLALCVGVLVGVVLAAIGQQAGREKAERKLTEDGLAMLRGSVSSSHPRSVSSTWQPGASTH